MENNRTPGIWQYEKNLNHSIFVQTTNESNKGKVYVTGHTSGEANAKFICKTANEYDKLKEENALLIEALDELYRWAESVQGQEVSMFITKTPDSIFTMAKELLNNLKK